MARQTKSAEEFQKELSENADYQRRIAEKLERIAELKKVLETDQRELVEELRARGQEVDSVWDLVNTDNSYPDAIPVLLKHLQVEHHPRTREGITRALATREARGVADQVLIDIFTSLPPSEDKYKWVLAFAISATATPETIDEVIKLVRDTQHSGEVRRELMQAIRTRNLNPSVIVAVLRDLEDDPELQGEARKMLKKSVP